MADSNINKKIDALTNLILNDYGKKRAIDEIEPMGWPNKNIIIEMLEKLKIIIYPGYYKNASNKIYSVKNNVAILLEDIFYNLSEQIAIVLSSCQDISDGNQKNNDKSRQIAFDFLNMIPKIREYLDTDIDAIFNNDPAAYNKNEIICVYPGLFAKNDIPADIAEH